MTSPATPAAPHPAPRGQVLAWGLWDWGSSAFNAIVLTFVFSVYLTDSVGADLPGTVSANSWLGWSTAAAGLVIALIAPVIGQSADRGGRRLRSTGLWTAAVVVAVALMFFVRDDYRYLWLGLLLLGLASIFFQLAEVSYYALLSQVSTSANVGRVSGFGWSMGYFGGIVLLLAIYLGLIAGDEGGMFGLGTDGGINIRVAMLVAAVWFAVFAIPMFFSLPETPPTGDGKRLGVAGAYRRLFADLRALYRRDPHTVYFLGASAVYRDGLQAVFAFGGVIAVTVYGMNPGTVLIFGVVINVVSALGALAGGWFDDRFGPKAVVVGSLASLVVVGVILLFVSGPNAFWVFGLILGLFVGPAQASSRSYLARLCPPGQEGQMFGFYATTGRAVSFLAPALIGLFTYLFSSDRAGTVGIVLVLAVGLAAVLPVRAPGRSASAVPTS